MVTLTLTDEQLIEILDCIEYAANNTPCVGTADELFGLSDELEAQVGDQ